VEDVSLVRRFGELRVGDVISLVVVAAARREDAFGAFSEAVQRFKKIRGLRKEVSSRADRRALPELSVDAWKCR
jgi:molybdopterin synthase catalytic subunit